MKSNYTMRFVVPFGDVDMMGHVNNVRYLGYLENVRFEHLQSIASDAESQEKGLILAHAEIDYKAPAFYRDELSVGIRVASVGKSSWVYEYEVISVRDSRLVALGKTVQVAYDYKAKKSIPIPESFREILLKLMESSQG